MPNGYRIGSLAYAGRMPHSVWESLKAKSAEQQLLGVRLSKRTSWEFSYESYGFLKGGYRVPMVPM